MVCQWRCFKNLCVWWAPLIGTLAKKMKSLYLIHLSCFVCFEVKMRAISAFPRSPSTPLESGRCSFSSVSFNPLSPHSPVSSTLKPKCLRGFSRFRIYCSNRQGFDSGTPDSPSIFFIHVIFFWVLGLNLVFMIPRWFFFLLGCFVFCCLFGFWAVDYTIYWKLDLHVFKSKGKSGTFRNSESIWVSFCLWIV